MIKANLEKSNSGTANIEDNISFIVINTKNKEFWLERAVIEKNIRWFGKNDNCEIIGYRLERTKEHDENEIIIKLFPTDDYDNALISSNDNPNEILSFVEQSRLPELLELLENKINSYDDLDLLDHEELQQIVYNNSSLFDDIVEKRLEQLQDYDGTNLFHITDLGDNLIETDGSEDHMEIDFERTLKNYRKIANDYYDEEIEAAKPEQIFERKPEDFFDNAMERLSNDWSAGCIEIAVFKENNNGQRHIQTEHRKIQ